MSLTKNTVIADTGFFLALANTEDKNHEKALKVLQSLNSTKLIVSRPVLVETCIMLNQIGSGKVRAFLEAMDNGAFEIFSITRTHLHRIMYLLTHHQHQSFDVCDISLIVLAEHLGHGRILATGRRDFDQFFWNDTHPFENLFE